MSSRRALIVKMGAIGDVITTIPAAKALHEQGYEIHWAAGTAVRQLLESYSWITLVPVNDAAFFSGSLIKRLSSIFNFWRRVAFRKWSLAAVLYFDWRYRVLTLPVRADRKVALDRHQRAASLVTVRSYTDEFARILMGVEDGCRPGSLRPLRPDRLPLSPLPGKTSERRIAIVPGGTSNLRAQQILRRWPISNYVALTNELLRRNWQVVLIGGPGDEWVRPYFENLNVTDCIAKMSIPEVISLCDTCDVVISHDTGPMHLAGLSQAQLIAIFGPTNPGHVLPRRPGVVAIWGGKDYACRPCYDLRTYANCQSAGCIQEVTVEDVLRQMDRLIAEGSAGGAKSWEVITPSIGKDKIVGRDM